MNTVDKVAVCSRSFSKNAELRAELLKKYKNVTFNDSGRQLYGQELILFLRGHDKAITALEIIDEEVLTALPELKAIGKYGVGLDMIDLDAMRRHNVRLGWSGGVNKRSVAELTIAFAITLLRNISQANKEVLDGVWRQTIGAQLSGRTVGIIGCGNVGKDLVRLLQPFHCPILVNDIVNYSEFYAEYNVKAVAIDDLLRFSDVVTLHVPLDSTTQNILSADRLAQMRSTGILINIARGGLVDEIALKNMLIDKKILGAAFDVFNQEPPQDFELLQLPNFLATPHIGGSSVEAIMAMGHAAIEGLDKNALP